MNWEEIPQIDLYSDGGAEPNPGRGGYGVIMSYKGRKKEFSQGFLFTTNNRMELMGVIGGLEKLKTKSVVTIYTDSRYVIDGITKGWAQKWQSNNWVRKKNKKAINHDLWAKLLVLIAMQHEVKFNWVKGHDGHKENERCDELANLALNAENLLEDKGYEPDEDISTNNDLKVKFEAGTCRKCGTPVIKKESKKKPLKPNQTYYYEYYLLCPSCKTIYLVEDAKRNVDADTRSDNLFEL
jgi:ribonuclease HI